MKSLNRLVSTSVICLQVSISLVSSQAIASKPADTTAVRKEGIPWTKKMHELYKTLSNLLTDVSSDRRFNDPANKNRIERETQKLASLSHDLNNPKIVKLDQDPTVPIVAALMAQETKRVVTELKRGNRAYARSILRSVPEYCILCHTRNASGVQFAQLPLEPTSKTLTAIERGNFYAATRQFDRAQVEYLKVIHDQKVAKSYNFDWEKAIYQSLAIAVRVKQDPAQAREIVSGVLKMKDAGPVSTVENAKLWMKSIDDWEKEVSHRAVSEEGLYTEALSLMDKARKVQKYPMDRNADILYLRASSAIHDLLQKSPHGKRSTEALLLAGVIYEVLSPLKMEDLHDFYYEACIRQSPRSDIAGICYRRLEQSVIFGFTGSAGTDIPQDVQHKLIELKSLSQPQVQIQP